MLKQATRRLAEPGRVTRIRVLAAGTLLTVLAGYIAVVAVLAVVALLSIATSEFSPLGVALSAGPGWLAAYQVPVSFNGDPLGVLPLAVTIGMGVLVARSAAGIAERAGYRTPQDALTVVGAMAGVHAVVGVSVAIMASATDVTADPLDAFLIPALVSAIAAGVGVLGRCGLLAAVEQNTDTVGVAGLRAGVIATAALVTAGSLVFTVASAFSAPTMTELFAAHATGFGSGLGMLLLCVAYLPNAMLAGLGFAAGPGASVGKVWFSPFGYDGGDVVGVPLFAGVPDGYSAWWLLALAAPLAVGAAVGWKVRRVSDAWLEVLRALVIAGAVVGLALLVLASFAGGQLGRLVAVDVQAGWLSVAGFGWIVVPGAAVAYVAGRLRRRSDSDSAAEDEPADDSDDGDAEPEAEEDAAEEQEPAEDETSEDEADEADEDEDKSSEPEEAADDAVDESDEDDDSEAAETVPEEPDEEPEPKSEKKR